jgi:FlaA1/EpsC-like NDP-sugar epimerase
MTQPLHATIDALSARVTGRPAPLFQADLDGHRGALRAVVEGRRVLVVGAAGSLGSSTVFPLLSLSPKEVCLVDLAENNLVELLRSIRSSAELSDAPVAIQPIDYGSPVMERFLRRSEPFDLVLNFSAVKHVRSERDEVSLLHLLDTNLLKADRFLGWLRRFGHGSRGVFFVSSDKAANPANLMGASKRVMEHMIFWHGSAEAEGRTLLEEGAAFGASLPRVTTARFANVAFSDGSLPWGFLQRLAKGQPLSGPSDVKRFLLSLQEAGQLCTLAGVLLADRHILVPRLDPDADMVSFKDIAEATLDFHRLKPRWCASDREARDMAPAAGEWPCYFSASDTMGEKMYEEFVADGERSVEVGLKELLAVPYEAAPDSGALRAVFARLEALRAEPDAPVAKADLVEAIRAVVPTLQHVDSEHSLDRKM